MAKFTLRRVPLNSGGYDSSGCYWGVGTPLWWYCADEPLFRGDEKYYPEDYFRASCREAAKTHVRNLYPSATFHR